MCPGHRLVCLRTIAQLLCLLGVGEALCGCRQRAGCGWSKGEAERTGLPVAKIGSHEVSTADVELHLARQSDGARRAYQDQAARSAFVDEVMRFELLGAEAERRGYGRDPEVILGTKQQMISRMLQDEMAKHDVGVVSADEVARYFEDHREEFSKPAAASIREIAVKERALAEAALTEAKAAKRPDLVADQKAFEQLAARYAPSSGSPPGQQSAFFEERSSPFPKEVTAAIFVMTEVGEVAGPVASGAMYHVIKLAGWRPAVTRTMDEVREQIRQQLLAKRRNQFAESFVAELRKRTPVHIEQGALDHVNW